MLATVATPVVLFIWTYLAYALVCFRGRGSREDGPPIKGHRGFQAGWLVTTALIPISMFIFGTYQLVAPHGVGTGSGANPIWVPAGYSAVAKSNKIMQVQVIGQQWRWTFRYPGYQGVETTQLEIPVGVEVQFNVTSLDVIHEFWAQQIAVKADANPGVNNIAFARADRIGHVDVKCAELCGTLHGAMVSDGSVVSQADFNSWISNQVKVHAADIPLAAAVCGDVPARPRTAATTTPDRTRFPRRRPRRRARRSEHRKRSRRRRTRPPRLLLRRVEELVHDHRGRRRSSTARRREAGLP